MELAFNALESIRIGWNLGNSFDCCGLGNVSKTQASVFEYERQWGNPVTDEKLIHRIKGLGYGAVRIPITWFEHMDETGNLDNDWVLRVKQVIDMVLAEGMYCIINVHHDTGAGKQAWLRADDKIYENAISTYVRIWKQLAEIFRMYGEKLLFEGFNEMLDASSRWDYTDSENYSCINRYNQMFVNTVRRSGGNNAERNLILNTYGASPMEPAARNFVVPTDCCEGHLIVGVHFYKPDAFSAGNQELFDQEGMREVDEFFARMSKYFIDKGIPVILGECGTHEIRKESERCKYAKYVIEKALNYKMAYFWWDDGQKMKIINRNDLKIVYKQLQKEITRAAGRNIENC